MPELTKLVRNLQSEFPFARDAKEDVASWTRRLLRRPHARDFRALPLIPDDLPGCWLDIGAGQGQGIQSIRLYKPTVRLLAFEPNPGLATKLRNRYRNDRRTEIFDFCLADRSRHFNLYVPVYNGVVHDGLASLDRENARGWLGPETLYRFRPDRLRIREMHCRARTLDELKLDPVFVRIGARGTEYAVLAGGLRTLEKHEPILLVADFDADPRVRRLVGDLGYDAWHFDGGGLRRGASPTAGTFLLTPRRLARIG